MGSSQWGLAGARPRARTSSSLRPQPCLGCGARQVRPGTGPLEARACHVHSASAFSSTRREQRPTPVVRGLCPPQLCRAHLHSQQEERHLGPPTDGTPQAPEARGLGVTWLVLNFSRFSLHVHVMGLCPEPWTGWTGMRARPQPGSTCESPGQGSWGAGSPHASESRGTGGPVPAGDPDGTPLPAAEAAPEWGTWP